MEKKSFYKIVVKRAIHYSHGIRMVSQYEEHDEGNNGADDDQDASEEPSVGVRAVYIKVVMGITTAVWRTHSYHTS